MTAQIFSHTICSLGEGAFWHPERAQFFWFDILGKRLLTKIGDEEQSWEFDEYVSAAGWVDRNTLMIASASGLWRFDIESGNRAKLVDLEAGNALTRSNDGRADPQGGFWIGTMGLSAEPGAGSIYRYYRGELRKLYDKITISNAICFSVDGSLAYFTDTRDGRVMQQGLDAQGWPVGTPDVFLDLSGENFGPDGAVVDTDGHFWNAQWGASRVACYDNNGNLIKTQTFPTSQVTCPAFGGPDLNTLFVTTAADGLTRNDFAGKTFAIQTKTIGQPEHRVIL